MNYKYYANFTDDKENEFDYRITNATSVQESDERSAQLAKQYGWTLNYTFESLV